MDTPFILGEFVQLDTHNSPATDGRKGIVTLVSVEDVKGYYLWSKPVREYKITVSVHIDDRFVNYVVTPNQLKKAKMDSAFDRFKSGFLAETEEAAKHQPSKNPEFDVVEMLEKNPTDHKLGFEAGYYEGWKDAMEYVQQLFKEQGFGETK